MRITKIECSASRTFNHPTERFANFRFSVRMEAEVDERDRPHVVKNAIDSLRMQVERAAEGHKQQILAEIGNAERRKDLLEKIRESEGAPEVIDVRRRTMEAEDCTEWTKALNLSAIKDLEEAIQRLPALRERLAALPEPVLLPAPEIHPGHPDHPDTNEGAF